MAHARRMSWRERLDGEYRAIDKTRSPLERLEQCRARVGEVDAKERRAVLLAIDRAGRELDLRLVLEAAGELGGRNAQWQLEFSPPPNRQRLCYAANNHQNKRCKKAKQRHAKKLQNNRYIHQNPPSAY